jgi:hypothetical protein
MKVEKKLVYAGPAGESCRVLVEGVVAATTRNIEFSGGNNVGSFTDVELGNVHVQGEGGDVYLRW